MSEEVYIDPESGMKLRKLAELKPTAAKDYQDAMLKRVEHFAHEKDSSFNSLVQNTIVSGLKFLLETKVHLDKILGDNKEQVQDIVEKVILFGL